MEPRVVERLEPIVLVWTALCGACVGSFLNVAVYRLPRRCLSVLRPARSFCPRCHHAIRWYENVPLLSWLALRGRCSACGGKIHWRYPLVEATTLILFAWLGVRDLSGGRFVDPAACALFVLHAAFASALLVSSLIDFEFRILPDAIDVPGLLLAPLAALLLPDLLDAPPARPLPDLSGAAASAYLFLESAFAWWGLEGALGPLRTLAECERSSPDAYRHLAAFAGSIYGAALGAGFIYLVGEAFGRLLRLEEGVSAMGFGDVKYMGFVGAMTGWQGVVVSLLVGCLAGAAFGVASSIGSGRPRLLGRDLEEARTPLRRFAVWVTGARGPAGPDEEVPLRPFTGLFARIATGDPHVPFGPFLSLGAFVAAFWPGALPEALRLLSGR